MNVFSIAVTGLAMIAATSAHGQGDHGRHAAPPPHSAATSPYASLQSRPIKALSDAQIADLRAGRGMGLALAAELNGYPGPLHVLELADKLALTPDQRAQIERAWSTMKVETSAIGGEIIEREGRLDALFASRTATAQSLEATVLQIAGAHGRLRAAHLRHHLDMMRVLTPGQIAAYVQLRGYAPHAPGAATRP